MTKLESVVMEKMSFFDKDDIHKLAKFQKGDLANVIRGLNHHCFGIRFYSLNEIYFEYINYEKELKGYSFNLKYKENNFYELLSGYVSFLSKRFINLEGEWFKLSLENLRQINGLVNKFNNRIS